MSCPHELGSSSPESAANVRANLLMHAGTTAGVLARARKATEWSPRARPGVARITQRRGTSACHGKGKDR